MAAIPASHINIGSQSRNRAKASSVTFSGILSYTVLFLFIVGSTWIVSSLAGNVMVEKARRESIRSTQRAREARGGVAVLRRSIDLMTSYTAINDWAVSHGFRAPDQSGQPSSINNYVASNR